MQVEDCDTKPWPATVVGQRPSERFATVPGDYMPP
jgi:hypothetical protein